MKTLHFKIIFFSILFCIPVDNIHANPSTTRITLSITDNENNQKTNRIVFSEGLGYTTGLDRGYDAAAFGGEAPGTGFQDRFGNHLAIYTLLVNDDIGTELGFTIQSLPYDQIGNMTIALGINPSVNDTITIKARITDFFGDPSSFPVQHRLILEDREIGVFTELHDAGTEYVVSLKQEEPELGRFYLHTTTETVQSLQTKLAKKTKLKKGKSARIFGCKDKKAKNYNRFSSHKQSKCKYEEVSLKISNIKSQLPLMQKENNSCYLKNTRMLKKGLFGEDIRSMQACISSLGYKIGPIDGVFGSLTYRGIISYQIKNGLLIDGVVGRETSSHFMTN